MDPHVTAPLLIPVTAQKQEEIIAIVCIATRTVLYALIVELVTV